MRDCRFERISSPPPTAVALATSLPNRIKRRLIASLYSPKAGIQCHNALAPPPPSPHPLIGVLLAILSHPMSNKDIHKQTKDNEQDTCDNSVSFTQLTAPVGSHRTCATNSTNTTSLNSSPSSSSSFSIVPVPVVHSRITSNHTLAFSSQQSSSRMNNDSHSQTDESPPRSPRPHSSHRSSASLSLSNNALDPRSPSPTLASSLVSLPSSSASRVGTYSSSASTSNPPRLHLDITPVAPPASSFISHPNSPISSQMNPGFILPLLPLPPL